MATATVSISSNTTATITYTTSSDDNYTYVTTTKIQVTTTQSGGWSKKYWVDVFIDCSNIDDGNSYGWQPESGTYKISLTLAKGATSASKTGTWKSGLARRYGAQYIRFQVDCYDANYDFDRTKYTSAITSAALANVTMTYYKNDGTSTTYTQQFQRSGVYDTLSMQTKASISRTNYSFVSWNTASGGSGTRYEAGWSYNRMETLVPSLKLYAIWQQTYASPIVKVTNTARCDSDGTLNDEGTCARVDATYQIWSTSGTANTVSSAVASVKSGTTTLGSTTKSSGFSYSSSGNWRTGSLSFVIVPSSSLSTDSSYAVEVTVTDTQGGTSGRSVAYDTATGAIAPSFYTIDILSGGKGIAFGGVAKNEGQLENYLDFVHRAATGTPSSLPGNVAAWTKLTSTTDYDALGNQVGYSEVCVNANDVLYRSFASARKFSDNSTVSNTMYFNIDANKQKYITILDHPKVLWSGAYYMTNTQTITLSQNVLNQMFGIVLAWSAYANSASQNYDWEYFFIPKTHVSSHGGAGVNMTMSTVTFGKVCTKYVYVSQTSITGHASNTATGTTNGITYANNYWVLRYVIGV